MSNIDDAHFPAGSSAANPRIREEMAARMREFHVAAVRQVGSSEMLKAYCHAIGNWVLNPNTDPYHIEMLFDEICHAAQTEGLNDRDTPAVG
jgi:hypothetical protein